jgi:hypothetical protein
MEHTANVGGANDVLGYKSVEQLGRTPDPKVEQRVRCLLLAQSGPHD